MDKENIVLFSSYAKLPTGTAASEMYKVLAIVILIDVETGIVVDADCTLSTKLSERFLASKIVGYSFTDGIEGLINHINAIYQGSAKKAVISALRIIYEKYREHVGRSEDQKG